MGCDGAGEVLRSSLAWRDAARDDPRIETCKETLAGDAGRDTLMLKSVWEG